MNLLCFDISSGGITAAVFNSQLETRTVAETEWHLEPDERGAATLSAKNVVDAFKDSIRKLNLTPADRLDCISIGTFLHNCVLLDEHSRPLTPVFTWLDQRGETGLEYVRSRLGARLHDITGCRYHPMFPVFKLASLRADDSELLRRVKRIVSVKALLINRLTGAWVEDHGMASASGLFNIRKGEWDSDILSILGLTSSQLPSVSDRAAIPGHVTGDAAIEFSLAPGVPVIVGSGDGFLANLGSECEVPEKIAVTLGTSAVARQMLSRPVLDSSAGTFCYNADESAYLLGCAGSNGGNVLDWGRKIFGNINDTEIGDDPPVFIPLLHGERSPEWDPHLTGSWHGLTARHTASDLFRSILEGVIFNIADFIAIIECASGKTATDLVLSGNGFLHPMAGPILAAVTGKSTSMPAKPGLASLRGAGICALRALGQAAPALIVNAVRPATDSKMLDRQREYRRLRRGAALRR
jgi:gluconokinase